MSVKFGYGGALVTMIANDIWRKVRPRILSHVHDYYCQYKKLPQEADLWHAKLFHMNSDSTLSLADMICVYEFLDDESMARRVQERLNVRIANLLEETEENIA